MDIKKLSQDELKVIVGILTQVQLVYKDSVIVNQIIKKLDDEIIKTPPPTPQDHKPPQLTKAQKDALESATKSAEDRLEVAK